MDVGDRTSFSPAIKFSTAVTVELDTEGWLAESVISVVIDCFT